MRFLYSLLVFAWLCLPLRADPVITEFMADNQSTLMDEDGAYSDWIEIHNPTSAPLSLAGWKLTDNPANLTKWSFPAITLEAGEFRIFFASEKHALRSNHTNFKLAAGGEFLALVGPDDAVVQQFAPAYPAQAADESYGLRFTRSTLVAAGASTRYRVPTAAIMDWQAPAFNHSAWAQGASGLGYGITEPGITVRQVFKNGTIGGLTDAYSLLALPAGNTGILSQTTATSATVNLTGDAGDGRFAFNASPPGGAGDNYAIEATGFVNLPTAGYYTFGLNSDDGGSITIDGAAVMTDDSFHGPTDFMGSRYLSAGAHSFRVVMFEGGGGDEVEFYAAAGQYTSWVDGVFRLVGDTANGGLAATTVPQAASGVIATNLQAALSGRSSAYFRTPFSTTGPGSATCMALVMRTNDGFDAWLDGVRVGSQNAPLDPVWNSTATAARTNPATLTRQAWNLTSKLPALGAGTHVLAIQGLNIATGDPSFLVLPELLMGALDSAQPPAFFGNHLATPGWLNGAYTVIGKVADTQFSVKRGFFSVPFSLTISTLTPAAVIRYTTDGSPPTATTGSLYTGPLTIAATTNLRAAAFLTGWQPTNVDTQTYLFPNDIILQQASGSPPSGWPASSGTAQVLDFGMDPEIVNHGNADLGGPGTVKNALLALPSVVITTAMANYFNLNGSQGFYANPYGRGFAWERPVSLEWINPPTALNPNGTSEFQINAGVRLRGGYSRSTDNPKHAFHLYFREDYGTAKLNYPLFGRHGAQAFDRIDFRTAQNYSWSFQGDASNTFLREESTRRAQLEMGQPGSHVRYVHLYLNGVYWGLYNLDERTEAAFSADYLGGVKEEYDVVKGEQDSGYTTGVTDGSLAAWQNLWNQSRAHQANPTAAGYFKMMGKAADGVTPTADPVLMEVDNLIDYLMLTFYTGNLDGCLSAFLGNDRANNWFGSRRAINNPGEGFRFFVHDFEHVFFNAAEDRTGPWDPANQANFAYSNPYYLHCDLIGNPEYRIRWADRIQKQMFQNGALTPTAWSNRINQLAGGVDLAIVAESARWGDAKSSAPFTKSHWLAAQNMLLATAADRYSYVLSQLRADGLYPSIEAPLISPFGGYQSSGVQVAMTGPSAATIYYMSDGSDPRAVGGAVRAGAQVFVSSTTTENLIPLSAANWRYLSNNSNQGAAWRAVGFNDTAWSTGTAELGYGDGDEATAITRPTPRYATTYFRKSFTVVNPAAVTNLAMQVEYDDGYAVYLNGTRIAGDLPLEPASSYFTNSAIEDAIATINNIPASLLVAGSNVIAVEIHQANSTSSDISMNLSLTATRANTSTPLVLTGSGGRWLRARAYEPGTATWSAMSEAGFLLNTAAAKPLNLAIGEIMYHPAAPTPAEVAAGFTNPEDFEYLEITNTGSTSVDLRGLYVYDALQFDFNNSLSGTTLAPGGRLILVANQSAFEFRYGSGLPVAGSYSGNLSNSGETITLCAADGSIIRRVSYSDSGGWPAAADGAGYSLVAITPADFSADELAAGWRLSLTTTGNPGVSDSIGLGTWLADHGQTDPAADHDHDGCSNMLEYALGGNPTIQDPRPALGLGYEELMVDGVIARVPVLTYIQRSAADNVEVRLESASGPAGDWADTGILLSRDRNPDGTETVRQRAADLASVELQRFWRLRVRLRP